MSARAKARVSIGNASTPIGMNSTRANYAAL
jgi:hypothetical protein